MSVNHEARVISALVKNKDMVSIMGDDVGSMMNSHKDIWDDIWKYYQANREVMPLSVLAEIHPDFEYDGELEGATKHYVGTLKEHCAKVELESVIAGATKALSSGKVNAKDLLDHFSKRVSQIQRQTGISRAVDVRDVDDANEHYGRVREMAELHGGQPGIAFGFDQMDEFYPTGMAPGHFMVLMGYSGHGKSWVGIKICINAWLQGYSPLIINLEMTPEELRDRIYNLISEYTMDDLVKARIDPENFTAWAQEFMEGKVEFNLVGNDTFGDFTVDMVQAKIEQYKPDLVFLDYLGLFSDRGRSTGEVERAKKTAREMKQLATANKIPILAVTAVTGKDKKDRANPPEVAQVAFSSEIEYAANLAFAVHTVRDPITQEVQYTEIVFRKNRHGPLCSFKIEMNLDTGVIRELTTAEQAANMNPQDHLSWLDEESENSE